MGRTKGTLVLEDGSEFDGFSFGYEGGIAGEVVFNTGMVGYPESLTDPSYRGQILVITFPLVGNYGVPNSDLDEYGLPRRFESDEIHVAGLIIASYSEEHSHWDAARSLGTWLKDSKIPALAGLDTRMLTKKIREKGAMLGKIQFAGETLGFSNPNERNLVAEVSGKKRVFKAPNPDAGNVPRILAIDCGMKYNITRLLVSHNVHLTVVPYDYDIFQEEWDGLFISNGPGDPSMCQVTIDNIRKAINLPNPKPIFGICLGNQLLALAAGAKTYKLKYGNRGMNQPAIDLRNGNCAITPQNHGFAVDGQSLPVDWKELFINANDYTNEGIIHNHKPFFSAQFHPEATAGPNDTEYLLKAFIDMVNGVPSSVHIMKVPPPMQNIRKVLILGSGGLSIGQAGEFDYSGSQAIKALKEEQIETVLINPNIATVQTSKGMADKVYFIPVQVPFVEDVIKKERPDGILLSFGGQTGLNCGLALEKAGILEKYNVRVLGTPTRAIEITEDRDLFAQELLSINEKVAPSEAATNLPDALKAANKIGYPVIVRAAFALGGLGSGFAHDDESLTELCTRSFAICEQVLVEKSMKGWKEIEYEVVRDWKDNCITVCNMENFDPLGIHTGDSIVIAPSQTLTNSEYFLLRRAAIKIIRHLGVVGECNIQYALNPESEEYYVIEVNARLSRSSALASKATGYPLAYVAAKLGLLKDLAALRNSVTKVTTACFEPSLDYVVVKIPCWDLKKFTKVNPEIGSAMKSVGEVMAIGRRFEEALCKAVRMAHPSLQGLMDGSSMFVDKEFEGTEAEKAQNFTDLVLKQLSRPSDKRVFAIWEAFKMGMTITEIHDITKIDNWFLQRIFMMHTHAVAMQKMQLEQFDYDFFMEAKCLGFSDTAIARYIDSKEHLVRDFRKKIGVVPVVKQIDTLAAEFPAMTNYLYLTYCGIENDIPFDDPGYVVLGCGAYRIGSSVEFDWCAVSCVDTLRAEGHKGIVINYNPETVSTDFDKSDRLYFEELSLERVLDIVDKEIPKGVFISVGGQIPNNLAVPLHARGVPIMGTSPSDIDKAEDRQKFSQLLDVLKVDQPAWKELTSLQEAETFCRTVGYPCLVRPSYVLSGAAMNVASTEADLKNFLGEAAMVNKDHPVVITKFILGAKEIEFDAVAKNGEVVNYAISEHVENAGVHSGDATLVLPAQKLYVETMKRIKKAARLIARALKICGPFNIQFMAKGNDILVIECNLRASRTFPFISKVLNIDFIAIATKAMIGMAIKPVNMNPYDLEYVAIKAPIFSFTRLMGADPVLGVEMASTGEVACFGEDMYEAYLKAIISTGFKIPKNTIYLSVGPLACKLEMMEAIIAFDKLGYTLYGSPGTCAFANERGVKMEVLHPPSSDQEPKVLPYLKGKKIDLVINIPSPGDSTSEETQGYLVRRSAVDFGISLITNVKCAVLLAQSIERVGTGQRLLESKSWNEYLQMTHFFDRS
jgi:carbamoyl-phosphate synthase/aspartate carbamoyltransferase|eukprot:CAMPEP_0174290794 /NCGR_PEP_ID=MMETSP0809-20121228/30122_1 /TAXON_ID=73025 ORGANISM="Eutreptiella gymnastica-like, Strain CCMP1594" /NCGR_SAMPLE_ID=MMETSP0809 /ASSEMBLY_ACC=CAM_ASM_000658 /LENGTH=1466 /DNA_ID=CAMNT_0015389727 /DNA_START=20 /DNA_END=4420 /DNA_ORIENTATION=-